LVPTAIASSIDDWLGAILFSEATPVGSEPNLEAGLDGVHSSRVRYGCGTVHAGISFPLTWVIAALAALRAEVMAL
jgi:hypothetical protein